MGGDIAARALQSAPLMGLTDAGGLQGEAGDPGQQVVEAGTGPQVQIGMNRFGDQQTAPYQHLDDAPSEGAEQLGQTRLTRH